MDTPARMASPFRTIFRSLKRFKIKQLLRQKFRAPPTPRTLHKYPSWETLINTSQSRKSLKQKDPSHHLLSLPVEIRLHIYSFLVVPGRVYYSPLRDPDITSQRFNDLCSYPKPSLNVFRVCRQIHDEAEYEYSSRNTFVLPSDFKFKRPKLEHERPLMSDRAWKNVRHISLSFSTGVLPISEILPDATAAFWIRESSPEGVAAGAQQWRDRNREAKTREKHNLMTTYRMNAMVDHIRDLYTLLRSEPLHSLELDISSCFCPMACHRLYEYVGRYITILQLPNRIDVLGAWGHDEMHRFGSEIQKSMLWFRDRRFCIHFTPLPGQRPPDDEEMEKANAHAHANEFYFCFECAPGYDTMTPTRARLKTTAGCWGEHPWERVINEDPTKLTIHEPYSVYYPEEIEPPLVLE